MAENTTPAYPPAEATVTAAPVTSQATVTDSNAALPANKEPYFDEVIGALNTVAEKITAASKAPETAKAIETVKPTLSKYAKIRGVLYEVQKAIGAVVAIAPAILVYLDGDVKDLAVSAVGVITAAGAHLAKANLSD